MRAIDITGMRSGRLTAVSLVGTRGGRRLWLCECECGVRTEVIQGNITRGLSLSCGCLRKEVCARIGAASKGHSYNIKHGMSESPEHHVWATMKARCGNPKNKSYAGYGERGIYVSQEWLHSFENFYRDMGPRPSPGHSVERVNNDGPYCKENCVWATAKQQANNRRKPCRTRAA